MRLCKGHRKRKQCADDLALRTMVCVCVFVRPRLDARRRSSRRSSRDGSTSPTRRDTFRGASLTFLAMLRGALAAARPCAALSRAAVSRCGGAAAPAIRCSSSAGAGGGEVDAAALTRQFLAHDAAAAQAVAAAELPMKLTGRSGELVAALYTSKGKDAAAYGKIVKGARLAPARAASLAPPRPRAHKPPRAPRRRRRRRARRPRRLVRGGVLGGARRRPLFFLGQLRGGRVPGELFAPCPPFSALRRAASSHARRRPPAFCAARGRPAADEQGAADVV